MDEPPVPTVTPEGNEKPIQDLLESLKIEQNKKIYCLNIKVNNDFINFNITEDVPLPTLNCLKKLSLKDIKDLHKAFYGLNSCYEFLDYIKVLIKTKKVLIQEKEDNLSINLEVQYLFKTSIVEIPFDIEKINIDNSIKGIIKELLLMKEKMKKYEENNLNNQLSENNIENKNKEDINNLKEELNRLKEEIKKLKEENKKLVEDIQKIKEGTNENQIIEKNKQLEENEKNNIKEEIERIKYLETDNQKIKIELNKISDILKPMSFRMTGIYNKTFLMTVSDLDFIKTEIEKKVNKKVRGLEKIYQATIDGGQPSMFHLRCDNIPNTVTIICSALQRRFGGFTTEKWDTSGKYKDDRNSFLFSFDKRKIYSYKCNGKAIYCHKDYGPTFGAGFTIKIGGNAIIEKKLYTYEYYPDGCSYNFNGDEYALSESGKGGASYIYAAEYEVFKVLFYD